jgi:hypothetical protein
MDMKRKLVTIRTIDAINPIEGADAIEVATIGGWNVVVKKGEFKPGDKCFYAEIDSFLPDGNPAWQFLVDKQGREFEGVRGHRLRTVRLRGQISQGFIVPLHALPQITNPQEGVDYAEVLGVKKWEPPLPAQLAGQAEGLFPSFIRKTDQERCVSGDTMVSTEDGQMRMDVLCSLDKKPKVLAFDHTTGEIVPKSVVSQSIMRRGGRWLKITLKSGKTLTVTDNHRIWCESLQAYRLASELEVGQTVLTQDRSE